MVSSSRRVLVTELAAYDRLLEVGIGNRPGVARALAERGCDVVGIDTDVGERTWKAERDVTGARGPKEGSFRLIEADLRSLAEPERAGEALGSEPERSVDAVYACNLPAELQRPTLALAERLEVACLFTTLGFEEPIVPVTRRSLSETTLYVARDRSERGPIDRR